jgi:preprotein translocase subunit YajC
MFISSAFAQNAATATVEQPSLFTSMVPLLLIMGIMYLFMIRPQQKRAREHQALIASAKKGDKVLTSGGIIGKIVKIDEASDIVHLQISEGVTIEVIRSTLANIYGKEAASVVADGAKKVSKNKALEKPVANDN